MTRAFLAFDLPSEVRSNLGKLIASLAPTIPHVRWMVPNQMHCTLKFFGEVEEGVLLDSVNQAIENETRHFKPVNLRCVGIGVFPNWKYPRILWSGLVGETEIVLAWNAKLEEVFQSFKIAKDPRQFRLHVTLGRLKSPPREELWIRSLERRIGEDFGAVPVRKFVLYKSELTKEGAVYTPLKEYKLSSAKQSA